MDTVRPRGTERAKVIEVVKTEALIGAGTESDPVRIIIQYWSFEGKLLAEYDEHIENMKKQRRI